MVLTIFCLDWDEITRGHSSNECTDGCEACSSSRSHARFQSVSVVSLHNELCLRVHLAKGMLFLHPSRNISDY